MSEKSYSWQDMADLTHTTQVAEFNFCTCEEGKEFPYDDCPRPTINDIKRQVEETLVEDWCPDCNQPPHLCICAPDILCGDCIRPISECGCLS